MGTRAQDTFEYLLAIGAVAIFIAAALMAGFQLIVPEVVGLACPSVDTANPLTAAGECLGM